MSAVPPYVVEYFLLGKTRQDAMERYTQDGGIGSDVWLAFARDPGAPVKVLISPSSVATTMHVATAVHQAVRAYRRQQARTLNRATSDDDATGATGIAPLENFVAATLHFHELVRVILPLTRWWQERKVAALSSGRGPQHDSFEFKEVLRQALIYRLGGTNDKNQEPTLRRRLNQRSNENPSDLPRRNVLQLASVAALIGVFALAARNGPEFEQLSTLDPGRGGSIVPFTNWLRQHAFLIAGKAEEELSQQFDKRAMQLYDRFSPADVALWEASQQANEPPQLIQRVFLNRSAVLADTDGVATIKADAANRVFDINCRSITWAVIDSGIDSRHPAFKDHTPSKRTTRVKATYDFTRIELIKSMDLTSSPPSSPAFQKRADEIIMQLARWQRGGETTKTFEDLARNNLALIAGQLRRSVNPEWALIEPLIYVEDGDADTLVSDHGTHVAGILGADWRVEAPNSPPGSKPEYILRGVCPEIELYDMRVVHESDMQSTEFALLAALEFVRFVNDRAGANGPVIKGVNVSLSIPYDVRTYGCGSTPVCVAADKLADSGVVVVAAAGNRGWNEEEQDFGNNVFCSITDPGNAQKVITVGSTHRLKPHVYGVSYFSSRGPTGDGRLKPDLVAPGEKVRGPVRGESDDELDGTSMAAPFVSGAAAMLMARHPELIGDSARIKRVLCDTATDLGRERYFQGHGLVDVLRALQSI